jgi:hypothetical protein
MFSANDIILELLRAIIVSVKAPAMLTPTCEPVAGEDGKVIVLVAAVTVHTSLFANVLLVAVVVYDKVGPGPPLPVAVNIPLVSDNPLPIEISSIAPAPALERPTNLFSDTLTPMFVTSWLTRLTPLRN